MIRLDLSNTIDFTAHRSGWGYCMSKLKRFHSRNGIFFNDFIEKDFGWDIDEFYRNDDKRIAYERDWIGVLHNPPNSPDWFDISNSPQAILDRTVFQEALTTCKAIVCLSDYLADWLTPRVDVPVISVKHPTEIPFKKWSMKNYIKSSKKKLVQIGYWLRKFESIENIKCDNRYEKIWLPGDINYTKYMFDIYKKTTRTAKESKFKFSGIHMKNISNDEFDNTLSECVGLVDLYDSSANNGIIECVARNTPLLVNRLPAAEEYLGKNYPLFFDDLDEASSMLYDENKIYEAHLYLKNMNKKWISGTYFANDLISKLQNVIC